MSAISAIFQAIIQGLTEFLPVSSSGHLSLYQHFTGNSGETALFFSVILHLGTLVAIFICFWSTILDLIKEFCSMVKDIFTRNFSFKDMSPDRRAVCMVIVSTAVLLPFGLFKNFFTKFSEDSGIFVEGLCFLYTAAILLLSDKCPKGKKKMGDITLKDSLFVGFFQGVALLPGVSRSGSTISSGLFCGFTRDTSVKYAFILGIPAILAGALSECSDAVSSGITFDWTYILGFIVSAIVGILAIRLVNWLLKSDKFKYFAYYTGALGAIVIVISIFEKIFG